MNATLLAIMAYILAQLGIGWWVSRRSRTEDDYLVAGRNLGYGLAVFTIFATWFGAETCIGAAGGIYESGSSAFGSAGIVVIVTFGLFTRFGGPASALASLLAGVAVWVVGSYLLGLSYAYLAALAAAVVTYVLTAVFERPVVSELEPVAVE